MMGDTSDALLTYDEAAELLGITPGSLKQMVYWKRIQTEPLAGNGRRKRIRRSEVQRYADARAGVRGGRVILPDEAEMQAHARLLASLMAFGLSTDGQIGASLRREMREQVGIMARSTRGRELLTQAWAVLAELAELTADGTTGNLSAAERARLDFFGGLIRSALAPYQDVIAEDTENDEREADVAPHAPAADQPHPSHPTTTTRPATRVRSRGTAASSSAAAAG